MTLAFSFLLLSTSYLLQAIQIYADPRIITKPRDQTVVSGESVIFICEVSGDPTPEIEWHHNGRKVSHFDHLIQETSFRSVLLMEKVDPDRDEGIIECVADSRSKEGGPFLSVKAQAHLNVLEETARPLEFPYLIEEPRVLGVKQAHIVIIPCRAQGHPKPKITWFKDINPLPVNQRFSVQPDGSLYIKKVEGSDQGNWQCVAENILGTAVGQMISLFLVDERQAPYIMVNPRPVYKVTPGEGLNVTCVAVGNPWPKVTWYRGNIAVTTPGTTQSETSTLRLDQIVTPDKYTCRAVSTMGESSSNTSIVVQGSIAAPSDVEARPIGPNILMVRWKPPLRPKGKVNSYLLYYTTDAKLEINDWEWQAVGGPAMTTLYYLSSGSFYSICVRAVTSRGFGMLSHIIQVKMEEKVPSYPNNVQFSSVNMTSFQVFWEKPSYYGETVFSYDLRWTDTADNTEFNQTVNDATSFIVEGLYSDTLYMVRIWALSELGEGPPTQPHYVRTQRFVPEPLKVMEAEALNSTTIKATWFPPTNLDREGLLRGYKITASMIAEGSDQSKAPPEFISPGQESSEFEVVGLQPDTPYMIRVQQITGDGLVDTGIAEKVTTLSGVPSRPQLTTHLRWEDKKMVVVVRWRKPIDTSGPILSYRVRYQRERDEEDREDQPIFEVIPEGNQTILKNLDQGGRYRISLSASNEAGWGQEVSTTLITPEGVPKGVPRNVRSRLQSPTTAVLSWNPLPKNLASGKIIAYQYHLYDTSDDTEEEKNVTSNRIIISSLGLGREYLFQVKAYTAKGSGAWSEQIAIHTTRAVPPAPVGVKSIATSDHSFQVWWEEDIEEDDITGYKVLYANSIYEDLDQWESMIFPVTTSAEVGGVVKNAVYYVCVAAFNDVTIGEYSRTMIVKIKPTVVPLGLRAVEVSTNYINLTWVKPHNGSQLKYKVSYDSTKYFYGADGAPELQKLLPMTELTEAETSVYLEDLIPFTTYEINVTALYPHQTTYKPPTSFTITTKMAPPENVPSPEFVEIVDGGGQVRLTLAGASGELGPIAMYYLVVVSDDLSDKEPDNFTNAELFETDDVYVSAEFPGRSLPSEFTLGDMKIYNGILNRRLSTDPEEPFRVFLRAIADSPRMDLWTDSPYSEAMTAEDDNDDSLNIAWIIVPVILIVFILAVLITLFILWRRYS